jgi:predicted  nucleic acid-binding Zn-ribbon protein
MFDDMLIGDALAKEDAKIGELEASLEDKNQHIQRLKGEVADIETRYRNHHRTKRRAGKGIGSKYRR